MTDEVELPWFPLWVDDFLTSRTVRMMAPDAVGIYILLLVNQWKDGPLPDDPVVLSHITNGADPERVYDVLETCFERCSNGVATAFTNARLEEVREQQVEKRLQKVRAGRASAVARKAKRRKKLGIVNTVQAPLQRRSSSVEAAFEQPESELEPEEEPEEEGGEKRSKLATGGAGVENSSASGTTTDGEVLRRLPDAALRSLAAMSHPTNKESTARTLVARFLYPDGDDGMADRSVVGLNFDRRVNLIGAALLEYADQEQSWKPIVFRGFVTKLRHAPQAGTEAHKVSQRPEPGRTYTPRYMTVDDGPSEIAKIDARKMLESVGVRTPTERGQHEQD